MNANKHKHSIISKAQELGFFYCGFSKAGFLEEEAPKLENWLKNNHQGKMSYMENHFDKRLDPTKLVPGSKSVISLLFNYATEASQKDPDAPKISKYAFGEDYHYIVKEKLVQLFDFLNESIGAVEGRAFVDSAPVMDKAWAKKSGLGWIGKNSNLIHPKEGSFFFIAELITDLEFDQDPVMKDYCGTCTKCIDDCPTDAIIEPYVVDGSKCISYLTIELKDELLPSEFKGKMDNWAFGCDVCQDVCPWNRFSKPHQESRLENPKLLDFTKKDWMDLNEETYRELLKRSPMKRTKFNGLKRNLRFVNTDAK
ncbi:MAG: tRNA epoxyqueuosine(34) reductase QueG [Crocinitomicaceae bacterium TMED16]|nr:MAG: tRNA epoxyqueuosine(34) reductase QueG [Crocinitomicaceae bacterium TMED16]